MEQTANGGVQQRLGGFTDEYGKATAVVFAFLLVTNLVPIVNFLKIVPFLKEGIVAAVVVGAMTQIEEPKEAAKYALICGMTAAVLFNALYIPGSFVVGGLMGAASGGAETAAASGAMTSIFAGVGALINLFGVVFFSPIGYAVGGVVGTFFNE